MSKLKDVGSTLQCYPTVRIPATSYLVPLFTLIYLVLFHLLPPYHLDVPCYLNNRQRYCSVWSERLGLFTTILVRTVDRYGIREKVTYCNLIPINLADIHHTGWLVNRG